MQKKRKGVVDPVQQRYRDKLRADPERLAIQKQKDKEYRERNKALIEQRQRDIRQKKRELRDEYLRSHPCVDCGFSDIRALQFDHLPEFERKNDPRPTISDMICVNRTWESIFEEIQKCEVRCANCHQIKHKENGY